MSSGVLTVRPGLVTFAGFVALCCLALLGAKPAQAADTESTTELKIVDVRFIGKVVKRGEALKVEVVLKNTGDVRAKTVKICARVPKNAKRRSRRSPLQIAGQARPRAKAEGELQAEDHPPAEEEGGGHFRSDLGQCRQGRIQIDIQRSEVGGSRPRQL